MLAKECNRHERGNWMSASRHLRLSELLRRTLNAARQMANDSGQTTVGFGHVLLALATEQRSWTATVLAECGLNVESLINALMSRETGLLVSIDALMALAGERAEAMGNHYTGTEHLVLVLVTDSAGAVMLTRHGADIQMLRDRLETYLK